MLVVAMCFWESTTNTFHLPCGIITPRLFDITTITGLRPTREPFKPSRITKTKHWFAFTHPVYSTYLKEYYASTENVSDQEHIAFLAYWPSRYVFFSRSLQVAKKIIPLATKLHEMRDVCLIKLILCGLYKSLGFASRDLKERENPESFLVSNPIWILQLWLNATFNPSLKTIIPPNLKGNVECMRLARITPNDGKDTPKEVF